MSNRLINQHGAVSLFVVIFAALLMTIVTIGFVQIMLRDQNQATSSDLSQSAYDSAQAGVEDAKRLLVLDQACKNNTAASTINCGAITAALTPGAGKNETECNTLSSAGIVANANGETIIQQSVTDGASKLDQAYTCVKVGVNTVDYRGQLSANSSTIIPMIGVGEFDSATISWFSKADVSSSTSDPTINFPSSGPGDVSLPQVGTTWRTTMPPLFRAQFVQTGDSFKLAEFDDSQSGNRSNANTLFLYPSRFGLENKEFNIDARRAPTNAPQPIKCNASFTAAEYACSVTVQLPNPIDNSIANRNAFLRLTSLYNNAHYKIELKKGGELVRFNNVQPEVDSTGRANDLFRRVKARIELKGDFTYPEAAIDMQSDLCKNFTVTDSEEGYISSSSCRP